MFWSCWITLPQTCSNPAKRLLIYLLSTSDWPDLIPSKSPGASSEGMLFLDLHRLKCAEAHRVVAGRAVEVTSSQHCLCIPVLFARPQFSYVAEVGMAAPPPKGSRWSRPGQAESGVPLASGTGSLAGTQTEPGGRLSSMVFLNPLKKNTSFRQT